MFPKCFLVTSHIVEFCLVLRVVNEILVAVIVYSFLTYPKFLHISHRENGSFEVLSLHTPSVTVDRRQL